ncbi:MAG: ABC transporter permease [Betaproteobacteria bacterium]|nr:ABC transporter permease [Betaproteobacteria bacterium]
MMRLIFSLFVAGLSRRRLASILSFIAIALGVALGVAVNLVNRSALDAFEHGVRVISGEADMQIIGPRQGFDEALYARVARLDSVEVASPVVDIEAPLADKPGSLRILGLDLLRAARIQPGLSPKLDSTQASESRFAADAVFLSSAAMRELRLEPGQTLRVKVGLAIRDLRVVGTLHGGEDGARFGLMDIAAAQLTLDQLGRLQRIDLRWAEGVAPSQARAQLAGLLPPGLTLVQPEAAAMQAAALSRAYRANLGMLAVVALATGAFLVFASQALSVVRRGAEFALLRALGVSRHMLLTGVLAEGAALGLLGGLAGLALGFLFAGVALRVLGGDLGAGYFSDAPTALSFDWPTSLVFVALGFIAAVAGSAWPARAAVRAAPAPALRSGYQPSVPKLPTRRRLGVGFLLLAFPLAAIPPLGGLPVAGYLAVVCVLVGAIALLPALARRLFAHLPAMQAIVFDLARQRVAGASGQAVIASGGVLASVALAVAMAIMVASFRDSVDAWLDRVLPADLYVRAGRIGQAGGLDAAAQMALERMPGVARVEYVRHEQIRLPGSVLPLSIVARRIPAEGAGALFPMQAEQRVAAGDTPIWISEAAQDLFGWRPGMAIELPFGGVYRSFKVAGVWRDYARQNGAVLIDLAVYRRFNADALATDAALWLAPGASAENVSAELRQRFGAALDIVSAGEIRRSSLALFDRTFAVTYALEACAVLIGLFGIAASFAAAVAARKKEFGMLRHLGLTRGQIGATLACEGALTAGLGVLGGLAAGGLIGVLLVRVINRQSFHWSMDFSIPWLSLLGFSLAMIASAALAARLAGAQAMREGALRAVREDS